MDGDPVDLVNFFSKLLNKELTGDEFILLSSIQKFRAYSWLKSNNVNFDSAVLNRKFRLAEIGYLKDSSELTSKEKFQTTKLSSQLGDGNLSTICGVGIDIQRISEIFPNGVTNDIKSMGEYKEIFTMRELSYAEAKSNPEETLAGIFCAKEAIIKSIGNSVSLVDLEILPNEFGKPCAKNFDISISHSADYVVAVAIKKGSYDFSLSQSFDRQDCDSSLRIFGLRLLDYLMFFFIMILFVLHLLK